MRTKALSIIFKPEQKIGHYWVSSIPQLAKSQWKSGEQRDEFYLKLTEESRPQQGLLYKELTVCSRRCYIQYV